MDNKPHLRLITLSILALMIVLIGCPSPVEDPNPPGAPVWVGKSLPESLQERGIDAENNRIRLEWHQNLEDDLAGYRIYRADTSLDNSFDLIQTIDLIQNIGVDTVFSDNSIFNYVNYFYYITSVDLADNESDRSDTISYMLINPPQLLAPSNVIVSGTLTFVWLDRASNFTFSNEYVLRLDRLNAGKFTSIWVCRFTNQWFGWENHTPIPFNYFPANSSTHPGNLIACLGDTTWLSAGSYRWKIKAISEVDNHTGLDEASGESEWGYFEIE